MESIQYIKEFWDNLKEFNKIDGEYFLPEIPKFKNTEDYQNIIVKNLLRLGAISKSKLKVGKTYLGDCRNASEAIWNGKCFEYKRFKFGTYYIDEINHFEDDDGYDVFVPIEEIN